VDVACPQTLAGLAMTTRSTFGDQPTKKSFPSYGFGTGSRAQANKLFISQQHTLKATGGTHSPGPAVYLLPASVGGKQPDGRKPDPPVWGFGTSRRFRPKSAPTKPDGHAGNNPGPGAYNTPPASVGPQVLARLSSAPMMGFGTAERKNVRKVWISQEHMKLDMHGMDSPGPAATYQIQSTVGKQVHSTAESPPTWVFGSAARASDTPGLASPGPAGYTLPQSVGPQPDSRRPRSATPGFGAATREKRNQLYLGPGHEKGMHGKASPGPAASYTLVPSVGKQVHSKTATAPGRPFSKASRWASYEREMTKNSVPGPGTY